MGSLEQLRVHQKAVPAGLQEMIDKPLLSVQEAEPQDVAIEPVEKRAVKEGQTEIDMLLQSPLQLCLSNQAGYGGSILGNIYALPIGIPIMLLCPFRKALGNFVN